MSSPGRKIIVVTGETGVGKDFLVDKANIPPHEINRANWGDIFSSIVQTDKDLLSYDAFKPGEAATEAVQKLVCQRVVDLQPVIVTSHPVKIIDDTEYVNWDIEASLRPQTYAFVQADPELIRDRVIARNATGERQSRVVSVEELSDTQGRKLELTRSLAEHVGADVLVLRNQDEHTGLSIQQLSAAINALRVGGASA